MGKLIAIVGNNASGKTTLTKVLCQKGGFTPCFEQHEERPYQKLFSEDLQKYAFPNQVDYMLYRAEQEIEIHAGEFVGIQDGGLDQDFHLYTRLFHTKAFLTRKEYSLCQRTYQTLRALLPLPDLIIRLSVPHEVLRQRLLARNRKIDLEQISTVDDLPVLENYLDEWLTSINPDMVMVVDSSEEDPAYDNILPDLMARILEIPGS